MKKLLKHTSWILLALLSACIPEDKDEIAGKGTSIFRFAADANFNLVSFDAVVQTRTVVTINRDAVSVADLSGTTSVDFDLDETIIDEYNTANEESFVILDPSSYSFVGVTGSTFEFGAGEFVKEIKINLDPKNLDLSQKYALPIRLKNPTNEYKISDANGFVLIQVIIKNQYDGVYLSTGERYNFGTVSAYGGWDAANVTALGTIASVAPWEFETELATRGEKTVAVHIGNSNGGFGLMNITVKPDNTVLIEVSGESGLPVVPLDGPGAPPSTYDPATKTFELFYKYTNANGTFRVLHDVLVYENP